ncbi:unnamed protein product, partial [Amoebophrya sp. A25]
TLRASPYSKNGIAAPHFSAAFLLLAVRIIVDFSDPKHSDSSPGRTAAASSSSTPHDLHQKTTSCWDDMDARCRFLRLHIEDDHALHTARRYTVLPNQPTGNGGLGQVWRAGLSWNQLLFRYSSDTVR